MASKPLPSCDIPVRAVALGRLSRGYAGTRESALTPSKASKRAVLQAIASLAPSFLSLPPAPFSCCLVAPHPVCPRGALLGHVSPEEHAGLLARLWPPPLCAVCLSLRALSRGPNFVENFGNFRQLCLNRRWSAMALPGYLGITEPVSHARNPACLWQFIFWAVNYLGFPAKLVFP